MAATPQNNRLADTIVISILLILFVPFVLLLLLCNLWTSLALFTGIALFIALQLIVESLTNGTLSLIGGSGGGGMRPIAAVFTVVRGFLVIIACLAALVVACVYFFFWPGPLANLEQQFPITSYKVTIEPIDFKVGRFRISEEINLDMTDPQISGSVTIPRMKLPVREQSSTERNMFTRQLDFKPLWVDATGYLSMTISSGQVISGFLCMPYCPSAQLDLINFPSSSFGDPIEGVNIKSTGLGLQNDMEGRTWTLTTWERNVGFTYVPDPYQFMKPIVMQFSNMPVLLGGILGFFGTTLVALFKKRISDWLNKKLKKPEKKPVPDSPPNED